MLSRFTLLGAIVAALVLATVPARAALLLPASEMLPDGHERPVIHDTHLFRPHAGNELLEADLEVTATDDHGISHYEYRWNDGEPTVVDADDPTVSYESVTPTSLAALQIRAVDVDGFRSEWRGVWSGITPSAPNIIVAGDSIASGYSRQWFTGDSTCVDSGYSYGSTLVSEVAQELPAAWKPSYRNVAWPGAGVGSVLQGGSDSCSTTYPSQVDAIADLADPDTWNVVVVTAGINSTNWVDVVKGLTKDTALSLFDSGDKKACREAVDHKWNLADKAAHITGTTATIADELTGSTNAAVYWTSYYQLAGSKLVAAWSPIGPECEDEMNDALALLHDAILSGLPQDVTWVDLSGQRVATQKWAGWPHPNNEGHGVIGHAVADAITG